MNKKHWITVLVDGSVEDIIINKWVDNSYRLAVDLLSVKVRKNLSEKN